MLQGPTCPTWSRRCCRRHRPTSVGCSRSLQPLEKTQLREVLRVSRTLMELLAEEVTPQVGEGSADQAEGRRTPRRVRFTAQLWDKAARTNAPPEFKAPGISGSGARTGGSTLRNAVLWCCLSDLTGTTRRQDRKTPR